MDKNYWNNYYKTHNTPSTPSPFAKYIGENFFNGNSDKKKIIELGCGDGRDSVYFEKMNLKVIGVEQCESAVKNLNNNFSSKNMSFLEDDFTNFKTIFDNKFDYVYSRFTLHAINEEEEDKVLNWVFENLKEGGIFFLEVRSTKDDLFGKGVKVGENTFMYDNHNRRFVDFNTLKDKTKNYSKVIESKLESGLAVHGNENPIVIRLILQK